MKFNLHWLREWVDVPEDTTVFAEQLTMAGLEVDTVEPVANELKKVVIGEVISIEPHPDAQKLQVCRVKVSDEEPLQIVCGAKNVAVGMKAAVAQVGGRVGELKIKKAKLRGVESFGMLCSAKELGTAESADGLLHLPEDAPLGTDINEYFALNDTTIDVDLTPNRGDCLSISGIAREVSVLNDTSYNPVEITAKSATIEDTFPVKLNAPEGCSQYCGRVIKNINPAAVTPMWMQEKLRRCGLRSIDPVVDVTNYVMLELGQPMHAFDLDKLDGEIDVRMAKSGEQITLLDEQTITLDEKCLLIADKSKVLALAGIMGGKDSGVTPDTKAIFLESAYFCPRVIAGRARRFGLHTDSSHRFERGVDPALQIQAIHRASELLQMIVGGELGPIIEARDEKFLPQVKTITLRPDRVRKVLGIELSQADIEAMLTKLGLGVNAENHELTITVPTHRFDIAIESDLIEEVARIYGYNNIPSPHPQAALMMRGATETKLTLSRVNDALVQLGFNESISYSFLSPKWQAKFKPQVQTIDLLNPLSQDLAQMRTSLWPSLIQAMHYNQARQQNRVRLFESGLCFHRDATTNEVVQQRKIAAVAMGDCFPLFWGQEPKPMDYFAMKGVLENVIGLTGQLTEFSFEAEEHPALHPGQSARIYRNGQAMGWLGSLHPELQAACDLTQSAYLFELDLDELLSVKLPSFTKISKFPSITRDLAILVDKSLAANKIINRIKDIVGDLLHDIELFDVYQGKGIAADQKSIALSITISHPERTLVDDEVSSLVEKIILRLNKDYGATLRE